MGSSVVRALAALLILCLCVPEAFAAPHSVEELFEQPRVRGADLSPDGTRVALAFGSDNQPGDVIGVIETARLGQPDAVTRFTLGEREIVSIDWLEWATPKRLLVGISLKRKEHALSTKTTSLSLGSRVYAVNADGSNPVILFSNASNAQRFGFNLSRVIEIPANDPKHVIMPAWTGTALDLFRVDIETGVATRIDEGNFLTVGWDTEEGRPALRYDLNTRGTVISVYGRPATEDDWSLLTRYSRRLDKDKLDWEFVGDAPGPGKIYVRTRKEQSDTEAIYQYDIRTKSLETLIASAPDFDMSDALTLNGKYIGASYFADRLTYVLADQGLQKHLAGLDKYFQHGANVQIQDMDTSGSHLLLYVFGPQAPGDYYIYDVARANLQFLMSDRPWLAPERLARVESRRLLMRDGARITAYLTWPQEAKTPLPLVVMPHGGPEARDVITFHETAQALAAQGWLVLQPNFRGSGGYGKAFAEAGHRQWSLRMQDDITDSVKHLIEAGIADRSRITIYGASYGGYAALAGAVTTPELYRAVVSLAGISDLPEILAWIRRHEGADSDSYSYWVKSIGDPKTDEERLVAASPRRRAAEFRAPVLLLHGGRDDTVPIEQSTMMERALRAAGKQVRMVAYKGEGHRAWSHENELESIQLIIAFLKPHLSPEPAGAN
jgi:dipeptidyl aminopeptidase/acylaminoacyl peptidase